MNFASKDNSLYNRAKTKKKWDFFSHSYKYESSPVAYNFFNFVFSKCAYCTLFGDMLSNAMCDFSGG